MRLVLAWAARRMAPKDAAGASRCACEGKFLWVQPTRTSTTLSVLNSDTLCSVPPHPHETLSARCGSCTTHVSQLTQPVHTAQLSSCLHCHPAGRVSHTNPSTHSHTCVQLTHHRVLRRSCCSPLLARIHVSTHSINAHDAAFLMSTTSHTDKMIMLRTRTHL